jgi:uncharacterized protein
VSLPVNAPDRRRLRRMLDHLGFVPGFVLPHTEVELVARDGVHLAGTYLHGPAESGAAVVVAPGFAAHRRKPAYAYLAQRLTEVGAVLAVDLRGHGGSGGRCTFGDRETLDVLAAAAWLRRRGHQWVGAVGVSMGGTAVLRAAGTGPPGVFDAVCSVSAPAVWGLRDTKPMRAIHRLLSNGWYRPAAERALRVRVAPRWADPAAPVQVVGAIAPTALLLVHGEDDHFYGPEQAHQLFAAAGDPRTMWIEPPGFGHAEDGLASGFVDRLVAGLATVQAHGRWPD